MQVQRCDFTDWSLTANFRTELCEIGSNFSPFQLLLCDHQLLAVKKLLYKAETGQPGLKFDKAVQSWSYFLIQKFTFHFYFDSCVKHHFLFNMR